MLYCKLWENTLELVETKQDNMYLVSVNGDVFSKFTNRFLVKSKSQTGYLVVNIRVEGVRQPVYIHRLVAEAFIVNPENKPFVNHKDGNKHNNSVSNLEWVTDPENKEHAWSIGLMAQGEQSNSKLTNVQVVKICELLSQGVSTGNIIKVMQLDISRGVLLNIRARRDWTHISDNYKWEKNVSKRNKRATHGQ